MSSLKKLILLGIKFALQISPLWYEIKSSGYGAQQDINQNQESDYTDAMKEIKSSDEYQQTMGFNQEKENNRNNIAQQKLDLEREKLATDSRNKQMDFAIARENKNKFDVKSKNNKTKK